MHKDIQLELHLDEDESHTLARAVLDIRGDHFTGVGRARRNPIDRNVPVIGEELAIARALYDITGKVMEAAQDKIETFLDAD